MVEVEDPHPSETTLGLGPLEDHNLASSRTGALGKAHMSIGVRAGTLTQDGGGGGGTNKFHTYICHLERKIDDLSTIVERDSPHPIPSEAVVEEEAVIAPPAVVRGAAWWSTNLDPLSKTVSSPLVRRVVELKEVPGIGNAPVPLTPKTHARSDPPSRGLAPEASLPPPRTKSGLGRDIMSPPLVSPKLPTTKIASWNSKQKGISSASRTPEEKAHLSHSQRRKVTEAKSPSTSSPMLEIATKRTDTSAPLRSREVPHQRGRSTKDWTN
ncbi:hypothetical protein RHMOL_Rhmol04G0203100 [Rhododendron molle]|uniref:Uncharacterized protein n=1 Tax=Rhododendron molle TaxID=49168 RepID=A0ACC0P2H4_RHOML|nr:hypothetical protein RHMOL_Rhmol04G0203100 [Rhododendron molle]